MRGLRGLRFSHGYLHSNPKYGTAISEPAGSRMWETRSLEQNNIGVGLMAFVVGDPIVQPCSATEIRWSVKHSSGKKPFLHEAKVLLRSCDASSLVIDRLCDWARGLNAAVACFNFDFATQKEQSPTAVLSSILEWVVSGLKGIPEKMAQAFRD